MNFRKEKNKDMSSIYIAAQNIVRVMLSMNVFDQFTRVSLRMFLAVFGRNPKKRLFYKLTLKYL